MNRSSRLHWHRPTRRRTPSAGVVRPAGCGRLGAFFTNTTPEGAPKLGPESRGCNAWSAVAGGVAARDPEQSPAMMTLPMDAGSEKCPATLRNPACVRPVHGMANKVEVLGLAARRQGLSSFTRPARVRTACRAAMVRAESARRLFDSELRAE